MELVAEAIADEKGVVEACLVDTGCWVWLVESTVLWRHGDRAVGSLE